MMGKRTAILAAGLVLVTGLTSARQYVSHKKQTVAASKARFESVYRAGIAIEAATKVGVDYVKFQELVHAFALEVSLVEKSAETPDEHKLVGLYASALDAYQDSLTVWQGQFSDVKLAETGDGWMKKDEVFAYSHMLPIVHKYQLPTRPWRLEKTLGIFNSRDAIEKIWSHASVKLSEANAERNSLAVPTWMEWIP